MTIIQDIGLIQENLNECAMALAEIVSVDFEKSLQGRAEPLDPKQLMEVTKIDSFLVFPRRYQNDLFVSLYPVFLSFLKDSFYNSPNPMELKKTMTSLAQRLNWVGDIQLIDYLKDKKNADLAAGENCDDITKYLNQVETINSLMGKTYRSRSAAEDNGIRTLYETLMKDIENIFNGEEFYGLIEKRITNEMNKLLTLSSKCVDMLRADNLNNKNDQAFSWDVQEITKDCLLKKSQYIEKSNENEEQSVEIEPQQKNDKNFEATNIQGKRFVKIRK